ncbi:MAG: carbonic anhydrase family protein [Treponema sp.]|nr:carbonic anhydrase family protein [Treponema sp.]
MLLKNKRRYLPLIIGVLVLLYAAGCGSAAKRSAPAHEAAAAGEKHWGYTGDVGPDFWHTLSPDYALAKDGKAQSPINIVTGGLAETGGLSKPEFHYTGIPFKAENNGHTIALAPSGADNYIVLDAADYALQQLHFHAPSEHRINGELCAMEAHLVHKDAAGNLAVVGILIVPGAENETLKEAFSKLPKEVTHEEPVSLDAPIDLTALVPAGAGLYRYDGSLTTPPCTEGVKWSLADTALELSQEQIDAFTAVYSGNNRPVQNLYKRRVYITK